MTEGLVGDKRRQATNSIRGYVYQAYQSVLAWMRLGKDEVLFLEGAEDFDVHSADGVTATQVKDTAGSGQCLLSWAGSWSYAVYNFPNNRDMVPFPEEGPRMTQVERPGEARTTLTAIAPD